MEALTQERKQFGKYLKTIRTESKLSQGGVARILKYKSPQFISNMEGGRVLPPLETLAQMAHIYNKSVKMIVAKLADLKTKEMFAEALRVKAPIVEVAPKKKKAKSLDLKVSMTVKKSKKKKPSKKTKSAKKSGKLW